MLENQTNTNNLSGQLHKWFDKHLIGLQGMMKKAMTEPAKTSFLTELTTLPTLYKLVDDKHPRLAVSLDPGPDTAQHCSPFILPPEVPS